MIDDEKIIDSYHRIISQMLIVVMLNIDVVLVCFKLMIMNAYRMNSFTVDCFVFFLHRINISLSYYRKSTCIVQVLHKNRHRSLFFLLSFGLTQARQ